jgi:hypothetical protein
MVGVAGFEPATLVPNKLAFVKIAGQQATRHVRGLLGSALLERFRDQALRVRRVARRSKACRLAAPVGALVRFHLDALFLACFDVVKVRIDARLIRIKRALVLGAWIGRWGAGLRCAAAVRKCKRAKRDEDPRHGPPSSISARQMEQLHLRPCSIRAIRRSYGRTTFALS